MYQKFCGSSGSEGDVEAIRVVRDPDTSLGKGIAYVLFKTRVQSFTFLFHLVQCDPLNKSKPRSPFDV